MLDLSHVYYYMHMRPEYIWIKVDVDVDISYRNSGFAQFIRTYRAKARRESINVKVLLRDVV